MRMGLLLKLSFLLLLVSPPVQSFHVPSSWKSSTAQRLGKAAKMKGITFRRKRNLHHFRFGNDASSSNSLFSLKRSSHETEDPSGTEPVAENSSCDGNPEPTNFFREFFKNQTGIDPTPEIFAIITIYFVEGALGLARLAQTYLLKDELHLGPAELSALTGIFVLPWTIKPLYGFLTDGFPLFGYQRKSYLIIAGLLGSLSYTALGQTSFWQSLGTITNNSNAAISGTVAALLLSSACIAMSDVVADGIVVTKTRKAAEMGSDPALAGSLQSLCWGAAATGGLLSAYFSGSLLEIMSVRDVFGITAILPLLVAGIATQIDESPVDRKENFDFREETKSQISTLVEALKEPAIWRPALFLFLWQSTPTADGAFFFFMTDDLGFKPEFMGRIRLVTAGASLLGVFLYNNFFKRVSIKNILYWSTVASFPLGMLPVLLITHANRALGIPDQAFIIGDDVVLAILGEIAFLPTLVLAARICPPGVEAVLFATLMSINNGAGTLGTEIGAILTKLFHVEAGNFDNLALLVTLCNVSSLYPLFFIGLLDKAGSVSEEDIENEKRPTNNV